MANPNTPSLKPSIRPLLSAAPAGSRAPLPTAKNGYGRRDRPGWMRACPLPQSRRKELSMSNGMRRIMDVVMEASGWELAPWLPVDGLARA